MDDYLYLLILAYFKQYHHRGYSIEEISNLLGIFPEQTNNLIDDLLENGFLVYQNYLLSLSFRGRLYLMHSEMETYSFEPSQINKLLLKETKAQMVSIVDFSKEKWFGKE